MSFAATWMNLEIIMLSEVSQKEKSLICNLKKKVQINLLAKQTHRQRKQTSGNERVKMGRDKLESWG